MTDPDRERLRHVERRAGVNTAQNAREWTVTAQPTLRYQVTATSPQEAVQRFLGMVGDDYPGLSEHIETQPECEETP